MNDKSLCMLRYYKRHIIKLKEMLNGLDASSSDLGPLVDIQDYLIARILSTEERLATLKKRRKSLAATLSERHDSKFRAKNLKQAIAQLDMRVEGYKFLLYVWRCFGDGVANKYVSKWNLKRFFYAHDSADVKQSPGFFGGKRGLRVERALMLDAISHNVPALLCDLTNIVRHGDVCLLGAADPYVIEVKSSTNSNKRVGRQMRAIEAIHQYLKNDEGEIGGVPRMQRHALSVAETHHNRILNEVVDKARQGGVARISPEEGLLYIAFPVGGNLPPFEDLLEGIEEPFIFLLNKEKTDRAWGNYYPFTLSIANPESLFAFLNGSIYIVVVVSQASLRRRAEEIGLQLSVVMADNVGFELLDIQPGSPIDLPFIVSEHFVGRLAFEFISLDWFFRNEKVMVGELRRQMVEEVGRITDSPVELTTTKKGVRDNF